VARPGFGGAVPISPSLEFNVIPSFSTPVITRLLMVILENVVLVAGGSENFADGR